MDKKCFYCGNIFDAPSNHHKYCSKKCFNKKVNSERKEYYKSWKNNNRDKIRANVKRWVKNNPNKRKQVIRTNHDRQRFGGLQQQVLERDNFECQHCGINNLQHITIFGKYLSVHHIDGNPKNNQMSNFITLCASCHVKEHHKLRRGLNYE